MALTTANTTSKHQSIENTNMKLDLSKAKIGDKYIRRDGAIVVVDKNDGSEIPVRAENSWYRFDGKCHTDYGKEKEMYDIVSKLRSGVVGKRGGARKGAGRPRKTTDEDIVSQEVIDTVNRLANKPYPPQPLTWTTVAKELAAKHPEAALWVLAEKVEG